MQPLRIIYFCSVPARFLRRLAGSERTLAAVCLIPSNAVHHPGDTAMGSPCSSHAGKPPRSAAIALGGAAMKTNTNPHIRVTHARPIAARDGHCRDRAFLHEAGEKRLMLVDQLARRARRRFVDQTVRPLLVEPDHPVLQCLTDPCRRSSPLVRELPSSAATIASSRRACAASFPRCATRRTSPLV